MALTAPKPLPPLWHSHFILLYTQSVILDGLNVLALVLNVVGCDIRPWPGPICH